MKLLCWWLTAGVLTLWKWQNEMLIPCSYIVGVTDDRRGGTRGLGCSTPTNREGRGSANRAPQKLNAAFSRIRLETELSCSRNPLKHNYSCNCRWRSDQLRRFQKILHQFWDENVPRRVKRQQATRLIYFIWCFTASLQTSLHSSLLWCNKSETNKLLYWTEELVGAKRGLCWCLH